MRVRIFDLKLKSKGQAKARSTKKRSYRDKCRPAVAAAAVGVAAANVDTAHGISHLDSVLPARSRGSSRCWSVGESISKKIRHVCKMGTTAPDEDVATRTCDMD